MDIRYINVKIALKCQSQTDFLQSMNIEYQSGGYSIFNIYNPFCKYLIFRCGNLPQ